MDHKGFIVREDAAAEFKKDISEKRKSLPKPKRNSNRGFIVRNDSNPRSFQLGKKVAYKTFRLWPDDVQAMYLKDILSKYPGLTARNIAIMMGCVPCTIAEINKKLGNIIPTFNRKELKSHDDIVNRFYIDFDCLETAEKYADAIAKYKKNSQKKSKPSTGGISIQNMSMTVSFNIDTDNIAQFLKEHGFNGQVTLTISKNINE